MLGVSFATGSWFPPVKNVVFLRFEHCVLPAPHKRSSGKQPGCAVESVFSSEVYDAWKIDPSGFGYFSVDDFLNFGAGKGFGPGPS